MNVNLDLQYLINNNKLHYKSYLTELYPRVPL